MRYLVPYDFTPITRNALDYALLVAKAEPGDIQLLHIIGDEKEEAAAEARFAELMESLDPDTRKMLHTKVRLGSIFKDLSKEAEEGQFQLFVMGTHGAKGLQKILGSHAIKVITSSGTPFIVTQAKAPAGIIKRIVIPVELSQESLQIVRFAKDLAKKFKAEVHLLAKPVKDEFLLKKLNNNILKVKRLLHKDDIQCEVISLEGKKSFQKEIIEYGAKHGAHLFAVAHYPDTILTQFDKFSQDLITNSLEIPVLIVNAEEATSVKSNYSFIGI